MNASNLPFCVVLAGKSLYTKRMNEILFVVEEAPEGGFIAKAIGTSIVTEADSLEDLHTQVRDAVRCHFDADKIPKIIRLHFIKDEVIAA